MDPQKYPGRSLFRGPGTDQRPRAPPKAARRLFESLFIHLGTLHASILMTWRQTSAFFPNCQVPTSMQNTRTENWEITSRRQLITNSHLENLQNIWKFPKRHQRNKPQATKWGGRCARRMAQRHKTHVLEKYRKNIVGNNMIASCSSTQRLICCIQINEKNLYGPFQGN